jgi:hypothetical protein
MKGDRTAPKVTGAQARILRIAREKGPLVRQLHGIAAFDACARNRWLTERDAGWLITSAGLAALDYYDADASLEEVWSRARRTGVR